MFPRCNLSHPAVARQSVLKETFFLLNALHFFKQFLVPSPANQPIAMTHNFHTNLKGRNYPPPSLFSRPLVSCNLPFRFHTSSLCSPFKSGAMHIGELIKEKMRERRVTVVHLSLQLCCTRANVYKILSKSSIDTDLLLRISRTIDYDFFALYSESLRQS